MLLLHLQGLDGQGPRERSPAENTRRTEENAMDPEFDRQPDIYPDDDDPSEDEDSNELLEKVVQETLNASNFEALNLIRAVAARSEYADSTDPGAVMEVVRAIVDRRFGVGRIGNSLVRRVGASLVDSPEATVRLERIWREARSNE